MKMNKYLNYAFVTVMLTANVLKFVTAVYGVPKNITCPRNLSILTTKMDVKLIAERAKQLAPPLTNDKHKGQAGRIGVFGGSLEYTGAPYFAAISALKVGADLAHVFCTKDAATVIKSYSPELIVHPILDDQQAVEKIEPWLDRLHVILIGPGLGREPSTFTTIEKIIDICRTKKKPLVIDADGLFFITNNSNPIKNYPANIVLTPNAMEFQRLVGTEGKSCGNVSKLALATPFFEKLGDSKVTILCKDHIDQVLSNGKSLELPGGGSGRRCGGQGDLLSGSLATFLGWALQKEPTSNDSSYEVGAATACYASSTLTRACNEKAFAKLGRSMTASDMIEEIHAVFEEKFELK